jgi:hypothetical protein
VETVAAGDPPPPYDAPAVLKRVAAGGDLFAPVAEATQALPSFG